MLCCHPLHSFFLLLKLSWNVHACMLSCSVVSSSETPWNVALQAPLSMELSRQEYWSGLPFPPPGDLPDPGVKSTSPTSLTMAGGFFTFVPFWSTGALKWALASTWQDPHLAASLLSGTKGQRISRSVAYTSDLVQWPLECTSQGLLGHHFWLALLKTMQEGQTGIRTATEKLQLRASHVGGRAAGGGCELGEA